MRQNKAEVYLSPIDNVDEVQTPSIQARTLCEQFRKRKSIWIVCSIVVVLLIVIIPTTIITIKKKNVTKSVTETASTVTNTEKIELTTESSTTGLTTKASTTAIATKASTTAITTKTSTIEITTEINTTPKDQFLSSINLTDNTKWKQTGSIIAGGNGHGNKLNQLSIPLGIYINDNDQSIYIADPSNHRIVKWKYGAKTGEVVAGGNGPGIQMNQIGFPTTMIVDEINDSLITCEWGSERIQRLSLQNQTNQQIIISNIRCFGLAMDNNGDLYVADNMNHTVTRWREGDTNGTIVAGGNGQGAHPRENL